MQYGWFDVVGNIGVLIMIVAYLLLQLNRIDSNSPTYSLLNIVGASLVILSLSVNFNLSAFIMEVFWALISMIGIFRFLKNRLQKS